MFAYVRLLLGQVASSRLLFDVFPLWSLASSHIYKSIRFCIVIVQSTFHSSSVHRSDTCHRMPMLVGATGCIDVSVQKCKKKLVLDWCIVALEPGIARVHGDHGHQLLQEEWVPGPNKLQVVAFWEVGPRTPNNVHRNSQFPRALDQRSNSA